jgi:thiamine pyrophosphokinase
MQTHRAILFINGKLGSLKGVQAFLAPDDFLVCVDGGLRHMQKLGLQPHLVIGDLDSISRAGLHQLQKKGVRIERFPVDKNETDLELAILAVVAEGYRTIRIVAALGGRLDQTLGNLFLISRPELSDCDLRLDDGVDEVFIIRNMGFISGQAGDTISLLPLTTCVEGVLTKALKYPLHAETLWFDHTRGISNVLLEDIASVQVASGTLLCIHTRKTGKRSG